jgi:hypothetical protein
MVISIFTFKVIRFGFISMPKFEGMCCYIYRMLKVSIQQEGIQLCAKSDGTSGNAGRHMDSFGDAFQADSFLCNVVCSMSWHIQTCRDHQICLFTSCDESCVG